MFAEYRPNAGIVVSDSQGRVLLCLRKGTTDSWQFPQGGIEEGETPRQAAIRELREETSLSEVTPIKTLDFPAYYDFPADVALKLRYEGKKYKGQAMYWTLFLLTGKESQINLNTPEPEFSAYRWATLPEAYDLIVDFKKTAYAVALKEFLPLLPIKNI